MDLFLPEHFSWIVTDEDFLGDLSQLKAHESTEPLTDDELWRAALTFMRVARACQGRRWRGGAAMGARTRTSARPFVARYWCGQRTSSFGQLQQFDNQSVVGLDRVRWHDASGRTLDFAPGNTVACCGLCEERRTDGDPERWQMSALHGVRVAVAAALWQHGDGGSTPRYPEAD